MHKVSIQTIEPLCHNVKRIVTSKPDGFEYEPGQATLVSIDQDGLREKKRPFTMTSLPSESELEFVIKIYPSHEGVTDEVDDLKEGDALIIRDAWGAITFKGKGTFIAGGAGVTPFLSILRHQAVEGSDAVRQLIFSNKTRQDLFLTRELEACANEKLLLTFTEEEISGTEHGRVDKAFLERHVSDFSQYFYVCGPPEMVESVSEALKALGADDAKIITEDS